MRLTSVQYIILDSLIRDGEYPSLHSLCQGIGLDYSNALTQVKRLAEMGLVEISRHETQRRMTIKPRHRYMQRTQRPGRVQRRSSVPLAVQAQFARRGKSRLRGHIG